MSPKRRSSDACWSPRCTRARRRQQGGRQMMDDPILVTGAVLAAVIVAMAGCKHGSGAFGTTTTTAGNQVTDRDAVTRLANARCDREVACENVGPNKRFSDRDACTR